MRILDIIEAKRYAQRTQLLRPHDTIEFAANYLVTNDVGAAVVCDDDGVIPGDGCDENCTFTACGKHCSMAESSWLI